MPNAIGHSNALVIWGRIAVDSPLKAEIFKNKHTARQRIANQARVPRRSSFASFAPTQLLKDKDHNQGFPGAEPHRYDGPHATRDIRGNLRKHSWRKKSLLHQLSLRKKTEDYILVTLISSHWSRSDRAEEMKPQFVIIDWCTNGAN
eukprot:scaffold2512_cov120-Cylindrotheca_fusiformis.AAC.3